MKKVCENCKWFVVYIDPKFKEETNVGNCHCKPPYAGSFPSVMVDDFCGDFEDKEKDGEREIMGAAFDGRGLS